MVSLSSCQAEIHRCRHSLYVVAAAVALWLVPGQGLAASPTVESSNAKVATDRTLVPPPRAISDITAILDQQKNDKPGKFKRFRRILKKKLPPNATIEDRARFFMKRGFAAAKLGRSRQAISDLEKANTLGATLSRKLRSRILFMLGRAKGSTGNRKQAIGHFRQAFAVSESPKFKIKVIQTLAKHLLHLGAIEQAKQILSKGERLLKELRPPRGAGWEVAQQTTWRRQGGTLSARLLRVKSSLLRNQGDKAGAEAMVREAFALLQAHDAEYRATLDPRDVTIMTRLELGSAILWQGRAVEAEVEIRAALLSMIRKRGRNHHRVARILETLANTMIAQGRPRDARELMRAEIEILERIGAAPDSRRVTHAHWILAKTFALQGRWTEALKAFELVEQAFGSDRRHFEGQYLRLSSFYTIALLKSGRLADALTLGRRTLDIQRKIYGEDYPATATARGLLAMALAAAGRDREALRLFARVTPRLLGPSGRASGNQPQRAQDLRLRLIQESHMRLLARVRGTALEREFGIDAVSEAFRIADTLRGQGVQRALNASAARASVVTFTEIHNGTPTGADDPIAEQVRREQGMANRIDALTALLAKLLSQPTDQQDGKALKTLSATIAQLRDEHELLTNQIAWRFPSYAALMAPKPPTIALARTNLKPHEALIATYVGESQSYVWAVPKTGPAAFAVVPSGEAKIAAMVSRLRRGVRPQGDTLGSVPDFDVETAHALYKTLLAPVAKGWKGAKNLLVVAHGPLAQLPFSVLVTEKSPANKGLKQGSGPPFAPYRRVPWLVRSHGVTALPTVSALLTLRTQAPAAWGRREFAGFADPWFGWAQAAEAKSQAKSGPALASRGVSGPKTRVLLRALPNLDGRKGMTLADLPRLPETAQEIRSIARALKADLKRDVFTGPRANERQVKTMELDRYKVIAFASHALMAGDIDGLTQPALAMTAPEIAGIKGDGLLTMDEILGLKLDADWVLLSACNTAAGNGAGAEAVSGLGRAFLFAGARALLVTHWQIESTSARALVTDLFRRQAADTRLSRVQALRQAKIELIDGPGNVDGNGRTVYSYAHPLFWAPFQLFGEGAATR